VSNPPPTPPRDPPAPQWAQPPPHDNPPQPAAARALLAAPASPALMFLFFARAVSRLRGATAPGRAALLAGSLLAGIALFIAGFFEYNWGDTEVEMATLIVLAMPFSGAVSRD